MTEPTGVEAALHTLYGAPLDAFIDERKRLAKDLRSAGDRAAATEVARLRKPSAAAWALNHVSREAPEVVQEWLAAGDALRDASERPAEVGGEGVRAAMAAHRAATARLMEVLRERARPGGHPLSEDMLDRARTLVLSAATDAVLAERLRQGRVTEEQPTTPSAPAQAPAARRETAPPPPAPAPRRDAAKAEPAGARSRRESDAHRRDAEARRHEAESRRRAERTADLERRIRAAEAELERLAATHGDRVTAAGKADKRVDAARRALRQAESRAEGARVALRESEQPLRAAEAGLEALRAELRADRRGRPGESESASAAQH